jgi:hypothetical protein
MEKTIAGLDPLVILTGCPIVFLAFCAFVLVRVLSRKKQ